MYGFAIILAAIQPLSENGACKIPRLVGVFFIMAYDGCRNNC